MKREELETLSEAIYKIRVKRAHDFGPFDYGFAPASERLWLAWIEANCPDSIQGEPQ